jgi:hypothetical protein
MTDIHDDASAVHAASLVLLLIHFSAHFSEPTSANSLIFAIGVTSIFEFVFCASFGSAEFTTPAEVFVTSAIVAHHSVGWAFFQRLFDAIIVVVVGLAVFVLVSVANVVAVVEAAQAGSFGCHGSGVVCARHHFLVQAQFLVL